MIEILKWTRERTQNRAYYEWSFYKCIKGRTPAIKEELIVRITDTVVTTLGVDREQVRVLLYEFPPEHWAVGGQTKAMQQSALAQQQNEVNE